MKNYKSVLVLVLSAALYQGVQAASVVPSSGPGRSSLTPAVAAGPAHASAGSLQGATQLALHVGGSGAVAPLLKTVIGTANASPTFAYADRGNTVQGLKQETKMAQHTAAAKSIAEPASEVLLLAGLSALAIAIRRQSPS
jgi:hypothetical protein